MSLYLHQIFKKKNYFSLLLALVPLSFIAGNLIININIILLIISSLIVFKKKIFDINYFILDKLVFLYFALILFTGIFNDIIFHLNDVIYAGGSINKTFFYFKYLFLYIILRMLIEKNFLNLKFFFISCSLLSLFVCFDIFFQYLFGKDIFGIEAQGSYRKLSGPFGSELIAGGYILRFSLFSFFLLPIFYSKKYEKYNFYIIPFLFLIFISGIILSGNRMPLIIFVFMIFLIILFQKKLRRFLIPFTIVFSMIFFIAFKYSPLIKENFHNFYSQVSNMITIIIKKDFDNKNVPPYLKEFHTFYGTWTMSKYIGGGVKNFRTLCHERPNRLENSEFICNMHPHNYYLEILTETGAIGFIIVSSIFLIMLYFIIFKKNKTNLDSKARYEILPFIFLFFMEIFPIKSSGSFFTTGNSTYVFIMMAILITLLKRDKIIEN